MVEAVIVNAGINGLHYPEESAQEVKKAVQDPNLEFIDFAPQIDSKFLRSQGDGNRN